MSKYRRWFYVGIVAAGATSWLWNLGLIHIPTISSCMLGLISCAGVLAMKKLWKEYMWYELRKNMTTKK